MSSLGPRFRLALARGLVIAGVVAGVIAVVAGRWGLLVVAVLLVVLGAAAAWRGRAGTRSR
ncbi:hypothetical protein [Agromyces aerolatus]|uniref:hypothetical protein n=1 Tax=Agromyces sp. LY-1074 TaxID=3074080 RepID=UPI0028666DF4|nr:MULTISPECIES: hypothetical protein [unclassified Agromyces]MDR5701677.1 hypothetical protein [Agromyces sp. LY-1074]MDR5707976.1 hypothetical protein [Agromyces sp. LY-1358]